MSWLFHLAWLGLLGFLVGSFDLLPAQVGDPGKTVAREGYLALMLGLGLLVPWLCTHGGLLIARRWPRHFNMPHKDYWLAEPRRAASLAWMRGFLFALGLPMLLLLASVHYEAVSTAQPSWPQPGAWLWGLHGLLVLALCLLPLAAFRRFPAPPRPVETKSRRPRQVRR